MPSKVHDLTLGSYDQVVALTQEMVNSGMKGLYGKLQHKTHTKIGDHEISLTDFVIDYPKIIIPIVDNDQSHVLYCIRIKSGTYHYWKDPADATRTSVSAAGWSFALPVSLGLQDITDAHQREKYQTLFDVPSDFSVARLVVDIHSASIGSLDKSMSNLPSDLSDDTITSIGNFLTTAKDPVTKQSLWDEDLENLGYTANNPNFKVDTSRPATFVPAHVGFQTTGWRDPNSGQKAGIGKTGNSILNYLCYSETTDGRALPTGKDAWLGYTANWTDGTVGINDATDGVALGTFALTREKFFEKWFVPQLSVLNEAAHICMKDQHCGAWGPSSYDWGCSMAIAGCFDKSHGFEMKPTTIDGIPAWKFALTHDLGGKDESSGAEIACSGSAFALNESTLTFVPGTNRLMLKGKSSANLYCEVWRGIKGHAFSKSDHIGREIEWQVDFVLESVTDGGLQVTMVKNTPTYTKLANQKDLQYIGLGDWLDNFAQGMLSQLGNLQNSLAEGLQHSHKLILPAGGVYYFKDPIISAHGDLLVTVAYNGSAEGFNNKVNPGATNDRLPKQGVDAGPQQDLKDAGKGKVDKDF